MAPARFRFGRQSNILRPASDARSLRRGGGRLPRRRLLRRLRSPAGLRAQPGRRGGRAIFHHRVRPVRRARLRNLDRRQSQRHPPPHGGELAFSMDDDVVPVLARLPAALRRPHFAAEGTRWEEQWSFADHQSAVSWVEPTDEDLAAPHEAMLGPAWDRLSATPVSPGQSRSSTPSAPPPCPRGGDRSGGHHPGGHGRRLRDTRAALGSFSRD